MIEFLRENVLPWSPLIGSIIVVLAGGYFAIVNRRGGEKARKQPSWAELEASNRAYRNEMVNLPGQLSQMKEELKLDFDQRIREVESKFNRKVGAMSRILRDIAGQLPPGFIPHLDPDDVAELDEQTIPSQWRARQHNRKDKVT